MAGKMATKTRNPASITAIAKKVGVSHNTVSLALHGSGRVRDVTRQRVMRAARKMGYRPNRLAQAMVTGRSKFIGVLIPKLDFSYMPRLLQAVQDVAFEKDYGLLFLSYEGDVHQIEKQLECFLARRVEGVVIAPPARNPKPTIWQALVETSTPTVFLGTQGQAVPGLAIELDAGEASRMAAQKLLALGHKTIAYLGSKQGVVPQRRRQGVIQAMGRNASLKFKEWTVGEKITDGNKAAAQWLKDKAQPTGVVCFSDEVAAGFVQTLSLHGIRIPDQVSVIGVDDLVIAQAAAVPLSTLRPPVQSMGHMAIDYLLQEKAGTKKTKRVVHWEWVERQSTGAPPKTKD